LNVKADWHNLVKGAIKNEALKREEKRQQLVVTVR
jgi:hypothetical protein